MIDPTRLQAAYEKVRDELLAERTPDGHWVGELSSSALSTATAISALSMARMRMAVLSTEYVVLRAPENDSRETVERHIHRGITWLSNQQNSDGGFGDTDLSHSNIATTYLVVAAFHLAGVAGENAELLEKANRYLDAKGRWNGLRDRYGIDKTFVVPIMTNLALAGLIDWKEIDPLPFELACVPQAWYRFVGMPVVSYAIPALVAIGQARFFHAPPRNPVTRTLRRLSIGHSLQVLRRMQPESGGYLEATPLTSFVVMSLASCDPLRFQQAEAAASVVNNGLKFLIDSVRPDGSWPIDTNLATWNTTLSINALAGAGESVPDLLGIKEQQIRVATDHYMSGHSKQAAQQSDSDALLWLIACQHRKPHPFTGAHGGFGWSNLSGAVPDADDTPGAILAFGALITLDTRTPIVRNLIGNLLFHYAIGWLVSLQNRDGGWPTFCRGWGKLPFDRSGTDLTAHVLRALAVTRERFAFSGDHDCAEAITRRLSRLLGRALEYIQREQHSDGSWSPLWFGSQDRPDEDNPVYGTSKVLMAYRDLGILQEPEAQRGVAWLVQNQNADGGWGSGVWDKAQNLEAKRRSLAEAESLGEPVLSTKSSVLSPQHTPEPEPIPPNPKSKIQNLKSSIEESALAVEALLAACPTSDPLNSESPAPNPVTAAVARGLVWLIDRVEHGQHRQPAPIGFYFAKLWYYEKLYPLIFTTAALGRACRQLALPDDSLHPETASSRSS